MSEPKVSVFYSSVVELISIANVLADPKHHVSVQDELSDVIEKLSSNSRLFLQKMAQMPFQGLEFFEIVLDCRIFNDVSQFTQVVCDFDNRRFIHVLTGGELENSEIVRLMEDRQALSELLHNFPWVYRGGHEAFESVLYDTQKFKEDFAGLITELYQVYFAEMYQNLKSDYEASLEVLRNSLAKNSPRELAEKIMNRSIRTEGTIEEYLFAPSHYINPHYVMAYNESSRLLLYDMRRESRDTAITRQKLSASLKVLSDETRLEILRLLILQPTYGKILADRLNLTTATISHHLEVLSSAHLVTESKDKNTKYFSVSEDNLEKIIADLKGYLYNK
ncbi:helix-turn-helix transcriptional regulator [Alicyclobacillus sp. SO9]|uniref:ArsR/SmtB family transcription factor n=1 Tax=Alicyclobacillus sp. SO9 TaxID=2665646 RepID=UPI0018E7CA9F|nr:metalloregulator ArsR/SmtB family transcription factor [Alicyclobacillus sp. SO9]QQE78677.1 helix-turn-helix transcriptional regulator [Alicyclobacillus sp. SO9]